MKLPLWPGIAERAARPRSVLFLGTCQIEPWVEAAAPGGHRADHFLFESYRHSEPPAFDPARYDAVVVALTMRHLLVDATGFPLRKADMALVRLQNESERDALLASLRSVIEAKIDSLHEGLSRIPTFFTAVLEPSFSYLGTLVGRHDPLSPTAVVRAINAMIAKATARLDNFHFIETNEIANWVGRMHLQDDVINSATHASLIADLSEWDRQRIIPPADIRDSYETDPARIAFGAAFWRTLTDSLDIVADPLPIKLVIIDLDDTLWRGVAAEDALPHAERVEGWPIGLVEALLYYRRRGGLLAVCSKNDAEPTLARMAQIFEGAIVPEDFVAIRIDWNSKADNVAQILADVNFLPGNVLFLDDNPRELDEVAARFPQMHCLRASHYDWRRIILRAPELQVAAISEESRRRTETTRALVARSQESQTTSRAEWLESLGIEVTARVLTSLDGAPGERTFELVNKTNQFNTTGRRWERAEMAEFLAAGGRAVIVSLKDRTTDNGVIGAALVREGEIVQAVLSCRVFGLGAETVLGSVATRVALQQAPRARGRIVDTGRNFTCHGFFASIGFTEEDGEFVGKHPCPYPEWVWVTLGDDILAR